MLSISLATWDVSQLTATPRAITRCFCTPSPHAAIQPSLVILGTLKASPPPHSEIMLSQPIRLSRDMP